MREPERGVIEPPGLYAHQFRHNPGERPDPAAAAVFLQLPLKTHDGQLIENQAHNTVTDKYGQFDTLYGVARFTSAGDYDGRDVYIHPLMFKPDGTLKTLDTVALTWTATGQGTYSDDVQTRDGAWITECLTAGARSSVILQRGVHERRRPGGPHGRRRRLPDQPRRGRRAAGDEDTGPRR